MARNRERSSLSYQVKEVLDKKLAIGEKKHIDKINGTAQDKIYSWSTYKTYMKHINYFVNWAKEIYATSTVEECRKYVDDWLIKRSEDGMSAYTQKLEASAIAKLYGCSTKDFVKTDIRYRTDITRSRGDAIRDKNFSKENNKELIEFCKSTGLRRSELRELTGNKLKFKNGNPYVVVNKGSKGGKYREVPVIGNKELVVKIMQSVGNHKVFKKIHSSADIHSYRSDYVNAYYNMISRPIDQIPYDKINRGTGLAYQSQVYHCRCDLKGIKYDKLAMKEVSKALGHNRINVIAGNYLKA